MTSQCIIHLPFPTFLLTPPHNWHPSSLHTLGCPYYSAIIPVPHPRIMCHGQFQNAGPAPPKKLPSGTTSNPPATGRRGVRKCWMGQQNEYKVFHLGPPQNKVVCNRSAATGTGQCHQSSIPWWQSCGTHTPTPGSLLHSHSLTTDLPSHTSAHLSFLSSYLKAAGSNPICFLGRKGHILPSRAPPTQSWSLHAPDSPFPSLEPLNSFSSP